MFDYVLFGQVPFEKFLGFVKEKGVEVETVVDDEIYQVSTAENIGATLSQQIEEYYEQMMELNQSIFEGGSDSADNYSAAGVVVSLNDGTTAYADIDGALLSKVMAALTAEELGILVEAIVSAVEQPDNRPLCQRRRA